VALWLRRGEEIYGPYRLADLHQAQAEGRLSAEDMVSAGDEGDWQPLQTVFDGEKAALPPPPPVPMPAMSPRPAAGGQKNTTTLVVLIAVGFGLLFVLPILAAIIFPVFAKSREKARQAVCMSNLKILNLALLQYRADNDDRFPSSLGPRVPPFPRAIPQKPDLDIQRDFPLDSWRLALLPYAMVPERFVCPSTRYAYQFNEALYGKVASQVSPPAEVAAIYDFGWLGTYMRPPHNGGYNVGYVDGHVRWQRDGSRTYPGQPRGRR
jgi:prepilin-type processing-associated H-X9-DG protein